MTTENEQHSATRMHQTHQVAMHTTVIHKHTYIDGYKCIFVDILQVSATGYCYCTSIANLLLPFMTPALLLTLLALSRPQVGMSCCVFVLALAATNAITEYMKRFSVCSTLLHSSHHWASDNHLLLRSAADLQLTADPHVMWRFCRLTVLLHGLLLESAGMAWLVVFTMNFCF